MSVELRTMVHALFPRTFLTVVASQGHVSCILNDRAYGKWNANKAWRAELRRTLEPHFKQITLVAPPKSRPNPRTHDRVIAEWLRIDAGAMY